MTTKTRVVNCKTDSYDVLIDRRSIFGNPYCIGTDGSRSQVIQKFRDWLDEKIDTDWRQFTRRQILRRLPELKGKILACHCAPLACHGDVYVDILENNKE